MREDDIVTAVIDRLTDTIAAKDEEIAKLRELLRETLPWVWGPERRDRIKDAIIDSAALAVAKEKF